MRRRDRDCKSKFSGIQCLQEGEVPEATRVEQGFARVGKKTFQQGFAWVWNLIWQSDHGGAFGSINICSLGVLQ